MAKMREGVNGISIARMGLNVRANVHPGFLRVIVVVFQLPNI